MRRPWRSRATRRRGARRASAAPRCACGGTSGRRAARIRSIPSAGKAREKWCPWPRRQPSSIRAARCSGRLHSLGDGLELSVSPSPTIARASAERSAPWPDFLDERLGDLEDVDREALQVAQRRVAGAEVVDREPDAERLELAAAARASPSVCCISTLSVISRTTERGLHAGRVSVGAQRVGQAGLVRAARPEMLTTPPGRGRGWLELPGLQLAAGLAPAPSAELDDQAGLLGQGDEVLRAGAGRARGAPSAPAPRPRTIAPVCKFDDRLVEEGELAALDGVRGARPRARAARGSSAYILDS